MPNFEVNVPATTANLGPGFDCLGMALDIWNRFGFEETDQPNIHITGYGKDHLPTDTSNLVYRSVERYFKEIGTPPPSISITCDNNIPLARGLGSSSATIVGGLLGASKLANEKEPDLELLWRLAVEIEGHPDNVTPALFGGCQIVVQDNHNLIRSEVALPQDLHTVLYIPDSPMPTAEARGILPAEISRADAIYNTGRVGLLVNALATGNLHHLNVATQDRLHQPQRQQIFPAMRLLFQAGLAGGALGVFLSGAGSTVLALTKGKELTVAYEMRDMGDKASLPGEIKITKPSLQGAFVTKEG